MNIHVQPGKYIVAVSGGVDSMTLLHILHDYPGVRLTVAHFDHGIREDSGMDRALVQKTADFYGLPFVYSLGRLGATASEDQARSARYAFLHTVQNAAQADAIITAHHKDDMLETAIINILRGTGRRGLTSLRTTDRIHRPLLHLEKSAIAEYATKQGLKWREDSTNASPKYLRNHIRHKVLPQFGTDGKAAFHAVIADMRDFNKRLDIMLGDYLRDYSDGNTLDRAMFILLPHNVAVEVMAAWLRANDFRHFDKKMLERLVHAAKIHKVGRQISISSLLNLRIEPKNLALVTGER
jgi:tRNA(Ile)-lysidine synthase